jgi:hypothetical protein
MAKYSLIEAQWMQPIVQEYFFCVVKMFIYSKIEMPTNMIILNKLNLTHSFVMKNFLKTEMGILKAL